MRRALDGLFLAAGGLGAICVALICALMIWQSIGRELGASTGAITDIVAWLCAASGFFTMAHAFKHGDFVRVTLLMEKLPSRPRRAMEIASLGIAAVAVGYLAWWACAFTYESWRFHELAQGLLPMPMWIPQSSFAVGSILLWLAVLDELVIVLRGGVPTYVRLVAERHAAGDYSSDL
ncbi:TRAP transporter small permease [Ideonella sp. DXS29W]|uniref:TRAP transporter small permease protein n=1 Tax=Ideonella lacteola TaxID=2984193 RepID=A0ABU9BJZ8_9BURK